MNVLASDQKELKNFAKENPKYTINDIFHIGLYPGSAYYEYAISNGLIKDKKKFIEEGCPLVNITSLFDSVFRTLAMYCSLKRKEIQNEGEVISVSKNNNGCDAVLKCSHCGHENHYKGISEDSYNQGIVRCRSCHNFSDYVLDKDKSKKYNTTQWLEDIIIGKENDSLKKWFSKNPAKNVALYGWRFGSAEIFVDEITKLGINVECVIDENAASHQNEKISFCGLEDDFGKIDLIVDLWLEKNSEKISGVGRKNNIPVVSIEEVLS